MELQHHSLHAILQQHTSGMQSFCTQLQELCRYRCLSPVQVSVLSSSADPGMLELLLLQFVGMPCRTRDCSECSCMLLCNTKPIIESSCKIQFGCFDIGYHGLRGLQPSCRPQNLPAKHAKGFDMLPLLQHSCKLLASPGFETFGVMCMTSLLAQAVGHSLKRQALLACLFKIMPFACSHTVASWCPAGSVLQDVTGLDLLKPVSEELNEHLTSDIAEVCTYCA